jgi:hypothetical protein
VGCDDRSAQSRFASPSPLTLVPARTTWAAQILVNFYGGTTFCDADGVTTAITFTHNPGNVPGLVVSTKAGSLTLASASAPTAVSLQIFNRECCSHHELMVVMT